MRIRRREEWEIAALTNPIYDVQRLGIYFTASPRHADLLLVTGAGAAGMLAPLRHVRVMPYPKVVIAAGSDAASGGLSGTGYATSGGVGDVVPVDVFVPGSPPRPLASCTASCSRSVCSARPVPGVPRPWRRRGRRRVGLPGGPTGGGRPVSASDGRRSGCFAAGLVVDLALGVRRALWRRLPYLLALAGSVCLVSLGVRATTGER